MKPPKEKAAAVLLPATAFKSQPTDKNNSTPFPAWLALWMFQHHFLTHDAVVHTFKLHSQQWLLR
jgi:hypothetical protein